MKTKNFLLVLIICLSLISCASTQNKKTQSPENNALSEYEKALVAMRYELEDEAIKFLKKALALYPNHHQSYYLLGVVYARKKNYPDAVSALERCLELKPDSLEAHNSLGAVYLEIKSFDKAEEEFKKSFEIDGNYDSSFNLARLYFVQDKLDLALDYVQKSLQKNIQSAAAFNLQGAILNKAGKYSQAITSFQNALRIDQNFITAEINLGIAYINNKDFAKAREVLEKVLPNIEDPTLKKQITEYLEKIKNR